MPALAVAAALMLVARPAAVFLCLAPFRFSLREKAVHLLGRPARRGRHFPRLDPAAGRAAERAHLFRRRLRRGAALAPDPGLDHRAVRRGGCDVALPRSDPLPRRVELDLPGQLEQEIVGYPVSRQQSLSAARPAAVLGAADAGGARREHPESRPRPSPVRQGDYVYLLAPPEKAQALDRFFVDMPPPAAARPAAARRFLRVRRRDARRAGGDLRAVDRARRRRDIALADHIAEELRRRPKQGDVVPLGPIALVAHQGHRRPRHQRRLAAGGGRRGAGNALGQAQEVARDLWARFG